MRLFAPESQSFLMQTSLHGFSRAIIAALPPASQLVSLYLIFLVLSTPLQAPPSILQHEFFSQAGLFSGTQEAAAGTDDVEAVGLIDAGAGADVVAMPMSPP